MKSMKQQVEDKAAQNPSSTKSMSLAMQKKREDLEAKRKQEEMKKKEDQERIDKLNRVSLFKFQICVLDEEYCAECT